MAKDKDGSEFFLGDLSEDEWKDRHEKHLLGTRRHEHLLDLTRRLRRRLAVQERAMDRDIDMKFREEEEQIRFEADETLKARQLAAEQSRHLEKVEQDSYNLMGYVMRLWVSM